MTMTTPTADHSLGELVAQLSEHTSQLVRDELKLAQLEMSQKGKKAGIGLGLFGGAGLFAVYGVGCLIAAAVAGLAIPLPTWAAALIVGGALFLVAGIAALIGKKEVTNAVPPVPQEAMASIKLDLAAAKKGHGA
jgi:hypothetical protein